MSCEAVAKTSPWTSLAAASADHAADLNTFFDVSLDLLIIRDLDGRVVKASRSWLTTLGHDPEDMQGKPLLRLVHPDDMPATLNSVVEVEGRRPGDPILGFRNRYRHRDGDYRIVEWRAQRHDDRIYAVARDVTDQVAAEKALIEAKAAAEAASQAKSDFLANMSHEIRTPLNGVIGIVDALSRTPLSPEQSEMVGLIRESGVTLERLVSDVLDVSKIEAGQLTLEERPFDLDEAFASAAEVARQRCWDKGLLFRLRRAPEATGLFIGDSTRIRQVVSNLLSNAVKFTADGSITLTVGLEPEGSDQAWLSVAVEDTGVGFNSDHATRLFERFSQADSSITRRFGGTGLGLSICQSLVEMMGGDISAMSTPGQGSRFEVVIPLRRAHALAEAAALEPEVPAPVRERPLRILLAEDHPTNRRVVQLILQPHDVDLVMVEDGAQAVAAFAEDRFDLVLMDMQMPVMDGLSATEAIRALETTGRTPIIMLSANAMAEHRDQAKAAGADLHVAKPITAESLLAGIETALAG
ncbi:histidine kinase [Brevundimonas sp. AAP58]|uniref:ATP-binding protein n=1 Tax=Brevundimonas sp. AAP58 TaxID=1523422 RepID=UPI0006B974C7|nr:ATP-binding protein [Brevundimonas sp. AAP58]KPF79810.1 histidine kinase [Brevundimonas sp. AAP58]